MLIGCLGRARDSGLLCWKGYWDDSGRDLEGGDGEDQRIINLNRKAFESLGYAGFYILVSGSMVFANKGIMHYFKFEATNLLLLTQFIFTAVLLGALRRYQVIHIESIPLPRVLKLLPISFFYCANTSVALIALRGLNVAAYSLVKRLAPIMVLILEVPIFKQWGSLRTWIAVFWMVLGTYIAANHDIDNSLNAYFLGLVSCCLQALYLIFVKKSGVETGLDSFTILYYHSLISIPLISVVLLFTDEWSQVVENRELFTDIYFLLNFLLNLSFGALLNYSLFLCTEKTSPVTTMVSGHVKSIAQIIIGLFTFGGVQVTPGFFLGMVMSILGGALYAFDKYEAMKKKLSLDK
eukprot:TRINITY_DN13389_c0_g2_i2.p1 TRINITY_DN13389_c0_g2~~TRINITY_DN13389_c0_g2_i2.p1  ORF type:complete len:351 (+),score=55.88 TRINITY_DN13389_c0_g2_i2:8-1060(+)